MTSMASFSWISMTAENKLLLRKNLSTVVSIIYAVLIVGSGIVIVVTPELIYSPVGYEWVVKCFFIYLFTASLAWMLLCQTQIGIFVKEIRLWKRLGEEEAEATVPRHGSQCQGLGSWEQDHPFGFLQDGHVGNSFLKFGAAGTCTRSAAIR
ncbi:PREDICTED: uncharacterized protein LOC106810089 [Priapulus caudatus]|uniref:Uncharacterized protein LOC106810089 n=1 Tax=Priapulus caudatus TaxID=37621 RepID=A0ABM1E9H9_PRICU|nr:PREDICTED: uncharacterized protein LOC106810089 [Priapulus caudatus]